MKESIHSIFRRGAIACSPVLLRCIPDLKFVFVTVPGSLLTRSSVSVCTLNAAPVPYAFFQLLGLCFQYFISKAATFVFLHTALPVLRGFFFSSFFIKCKWFVQKVCEFKWSRQYDVFIHMMSQSAQRWATSDHYIHWSFFTICMFDLIGTIVCACVFNRRVNWQT